MSTFCDPMVCSPPVFSIHEISQTRILEWVTISFSRGSSQPRDQTRASAEAPELQADSLPLSHQGSPHMLHTLVTIHRSHNVDVSPKMKGRKWNNVICSYMDGPGDYHPKWSKPDRERQISHEITYMWNLKYDTNEPFTKHKQTHRQRKQTYVY